MQPRLLQRQSLVITPQLRQAITLLQMSNLELSEHAEQMAAENPFLRVERPAAAAPAAAPLPRGAAGARAAGAADDNPVERLANPRELSLCAHVFAEADALIGPGPDRAIAYALCEAIDPTGWLTEPLAQIAAEIGADEADVARVLATLQTMEPAGLFARSLSECLLLQARACGAACKGLEALLGHLPLLAQGDLAALRRKTGLDLEALGAAVRQVRSFDPKPGLRFSGDIERPVNEPDLIAFQRDGAWMVELNRSTLPAVRVDTEYGEAVRARLREDDKIAYVREAVSSAHWLKRAIAQRNETTRAIGAEIVRYQQAFLEGGVAHLRPLQLRMVAEAVGVHESTVSRVTSAVMIATPRGCFPLKAFFSGALQSDDKEEGASAKAIRQRIREIIAAEDPKKPLSDEAIAQMIADDGTQLARRTVAKYRELEGIPSSSRRRRRRVIDTLCA